MKDMPSFKTPPNRQADPDWPLVQRFQSGEEEAFHELFVRFQRSVFNLTVRVLGNREDAEDACQEVFISIRRALPKFRGESRLSRSPRPGPHKLKPGFRFTRKYARHGRNLRRFPEL